MRESQKKVVRIQDVQQVHSSDKAIYYNIAGRFHWIPLSQIVDQGDGWIEIPEWLAVDKELI